MIKIDASNVIPKRLGTYLLGLIPGVVFELTVAFGDPLKAHELIERVKQVYPFQAYALLLIFASSCLILGQTFFLLAWFVDWLIDFFYRSLRYLLLDLTLGSNWLYKLVGRMQGVPPKPNFRRLWRIIMWARQKKFPFEIRPVLKCQRMAATQILKRKYGVTPSTGAFHWVDQEWETWLAVLGKPPAGFRAAFLTMRTFLGCSLAEIAALYSVPALRNQYFLAMAGVLLAAGCFQSLSIARRRWEPMIGSLARLVVLMEELRETNAATPTEKKSATGGLALSISGDSDDSGKESD
ncbi:MAG: hypothetical protein ABSE46_11115 [Terracidiphilus sp.]|jgi:hypothetical protein